MHRDGQSLIEVLIGIGLVAFFVVAGAGIIAPSLQTNSQAAQVQAKAQLGNELLQNVKAWAAGNWDNVLSLATGTGNPYYINDTVSPLVAATGSQTKVSNYTYTRYFYLSDVYRDSNGYVTSTASGTVVYDPSTKRVTVVVQNASSSGAVVPVTYVEYLIRTTNNIFNQTNWSGNPSQSLPATLVNGDFASSSNIAGTISGSLPMSLAGAVTSIYTASATISTYNVTGAGANAIAFDGTNMWTANCTSNSVTKVSPVGAMTTYTGTGACPDGIAFDGTNMWTANGGATSSVTEVSPSGAMTTYALANSPRAIAFDGTNIWTANWAVSSAAVTKISPGGATTTYAGAAADADGIAYDGAGNMWVSYYQGNGTVSKVNASSGVFTNYSGGGGYEDSIAFDGTNIWQMDTDDGILTKFSPAGSVLAEYNIGASGRGGIAYDGAGNMWVNGAVGSGGGVTLINKNTGATTTYSGSGIGGGTNIGPVQIASDGTGNMWTVNGPYVSSTVMKISPTGIIPVGAMTTYTGTGACPDGIAFDGTNMWTANGGATSSVTEVSPVGAMTTYALPSSTLLKAIAFDGTNMWTANWAVSPAVTKISPTGTATNYAGLPDDADGIAYDGAGNMWVSYYNGNGTVSKVNASSGVFTNYSGGGGYEDSIAFDGTNIWQMDTDDGILTKFSPAGSVLAEYNIGASGRGGIAYDGAGNMWVSGAGSVILINKNTGATTTYFGSGIGGGSNIGPVQIASDGTGNMWTVNGPYVSSTVTKISPTGTVATYSGGGAGTNAIAYDGAGNMWTANCTSNSVTKVAIVPHAGGGGTTITVASQGSGYVASGTLDSVTLDTGVASGTQLNSFIWQGSANSSTAVKFQVAVSNSSSGPWNYMGPSGDASTYFTGSPGASISLASTNGSYALFAGYRYFRYRATLYSDGAHLYTPNLTGIVVNWSP